MFQLTWIAAEHCDNTWSYDIIVFPSQFIHRLLWSLVAVVTIINRHIETLLRDDVMIGLSDIWPNFPLHYTPNCIWLHYTPNCIWLHYTPNSPKISWGYKHWLLFQLDFFLPFSPIHLFAPWPSGHDDSESNDQLVYQGKYHLGSPRESSADWSNHLLIGSPNSLHDLLSFLTQ